MFGWVFLRGKSRDTKIFRRELMGRVGKMGQNKKSGQGRPHLRQEVQGGHRWLRRGHGGSLKQGAGVAVDVVDDVAVIVEEHTLSGFGRVAGPLGEGYAIGVTCAHKSKECISHLSGECTWTDTTTRVSHHKVGVAEPETDVKTMESTHTTIEERWLPIEPSEIERSWLHSLGIDGTDDAIARAVDVAEEFDGCLVGQGLTVGFDDGLGITTGLGALDKGNELLVGERFEGGIGAADGILAGSGGENHRHIGRSTVGVLEEGSLGDVTAIGNRAEGTTHHAIAFGLLVELGSGLVGQTEVFDPRHGGEFLHAATCLLIYVLAKGSAVVLIDGAIDVSAEGYSFADQAFAFVHSDEGADFGATTRLAHDGDVGRITAEGFDVVLHPFEGFDEVEDADIAGIGITWVNSREIGETDGAQTMVDGDEDDIAITTEVLAMVAILFDAITIGEAAAVDPEEDGALLAIGQTLGPDVEFEAILTYVVVVPVVGEGVVVVGILAFGELRCRSGIKDGGQGVVPGCGSLGGKEATFAFGGLSVGDAEVGVGAVKDVALDVAILGLGYGDVVADVELLLIGGVGRLSGLLGTGGQQTEDEGEDVEGFHKGWY